MYTTDKNVFLEFILLN